MLILQVRAEDLCQNHRHRSKSSKSASSNVTAARNRITVILSMNIASIEDINMNVIKIGITLYFTAFAIVMQSHLKNPAAAIPSTMIIIPAMNTIVSQLIPAEASLASPAVCQNPGEKILCMFSVSIIARGAVHTDSKYKNQCKERTSQRNNMSFPYFCDDQNEHRQENYYCKNLCYHFFPP